MKRILCMILSVSLIFGFTGEVFASDTITFVDEKGEEVKEDKKTETKEEPKTEEKKEESKQATLEVTAQNNYVALGSDLNASQRASVLSAMGLTEEKLANCNVVYVTNDEEHAYLDKYVDSAIIGHNSLSSVLVRPASTGHGVTVKTHNINYCTEAMYQNALITAGVTDADVFVVGPSPISGTAALIGALKAYSQMSGKPVNEKALDTALDELVTTGEVKEALGDDKAAEELISYIKAQIAANDLNTREEIEAAVRKGNKELNANLTEEQIVQIIEVMVKIKEMGIDFNVLAEQADKIYSKYGDQIKAGTFNIEDVDWNDLGIGKVISKAVGNFMEGLGSSVKSFFGGLLKK